MGDWLVREDLERGRLVPLLEGYSTPPAPIYALSPPGRFSSPTIRALTDHLATTFGANLGADRAGPQPARRRRSLPPSP